MLAPRRENDARRVVQSVQDHSNTMEALRRATAKPYSPDTQYNAAKSYTFVDGADVVSKGEGLDAKYFRNNVRKI